MENAKYWRVLEAVEALGGGTALEVHDWVVAHYSKDPPGNIRADLEHLTVNSASRPYYDKSRANWRSDSGHPRDRLFKVVEPRPRRAYFLLFDPSMFGHVDLRKDASGKWKVISIDSRKRRDPEAVGRGDAIKHAPPLASDYDARVWIMRTVAERLGQPWFRTRLLSAYGAQCAISGCSAVDVLEAAHVLPYRGEHTNRVDNGLLLRSDLHTLFDCHLLWITSEYTVALAPVLQNTEYKAFEGKKIRLPKLKTDHPLPAHLEMHAASCLARYAMPAAGNTRKK